jgi:NhaA family Na+:H+ antiporter
VDGETRASEPGGETHTHDDARTTVRVTLRVREGREREFESYLAGITEAASNFPGYLGMRVFRPARGDRRYAVVLRFNRESDLRRWTDSEERQRWIEHGEDLSEGPPWITNITGTAQEQPLALALTPLEHFVRTSVSGIGLLLLGTAVAIVMANSPLSDSYARLWEAELTIGVGRYGITESLRRWVNDGLMALFFFIVGLEIKREVLVGELRLLRQAALPIAAALGGAVGPALVYLAVILGGEGSHGWGIPIGTDTAFSLGIMSLLGGRVRPMLLVFLTAFAIVDDILAVLVIAVFYTDTISWPALGAAAALLLILVVANRAGLRRWPVYAVLGGGVWLAVFESGVHGTIAGVLVALTVPARSWINPSEFLRRGRALMDDFERAGYETSGMHSNAPQQQVSKSIERLTEQVETPMTHFQHQLDPWVAFGVLPIFAFANAGIPLTDGLGDALTSPVTWGVVAGLVVGKPIGITLFTWLAVRSGIALKSDVIAWRDIFGVAWLGGIGFTMSLFITELAFGEDQLADAARVGILIGSVVAGVAGYFILKAALPPPGAEADA